MSYEKINLSNILDGTIEEKFQYVLNVVKNNILDRNTDFKFCREINIKLTFTPNEHKNYISCKGSVSSKLAPVKDYSKGLSLAEVNGRIDLYQDNGVDKDLFNVEDEELNVIDIRNM